jgi:hypothetical protein
MTIKELIANHKTRNEKIEKCSIECNEMLKNWLTPIIENCKKRLELEKDLKDNEELKRRKRNNKNTRFIPL